MVEKERVCRRAFPKDRNIHFMIRHRRRNNKAAHWMRIILIFNHTPFGSICFINKFYSIRQTHTNRHIEDSFRAHAVVGLNAGARHPAMGGLGFTAFWWDTHSNNIREIQTE